MLNDPKPEIVFPLDFAFKVMVKPDKVAENQLVNLTVSLLGSDRIRKISQKLSKAGKFTSFTLVVFLHSRKELEDLYAAFKALDGVVYLL